MIRTISDIISSNYITINACDSIQKIQDLILDSDCHYFLVVENDKTVGVLTYKNLFKAHPNRIVADAMTSSITYINSNTYIWKAKEIFDKSGEDVLLVRDDNRLLGMLIKNQLYKELGKHIDLLTGLYKSDYIYYKTLKLIKEGIAPVIIFIDLNNFGYINKKYGHIKGDIVLKELSKILKDNIPKDTFFSRFAGDEFIVLTPYSIDQSINLAKYLIKIVSSSPFIDNIDVTISVGVSVAKENKLINDNIISLVYKMINAASLASTKAKNNEENLIVANTDSIHESA
ncbi:GGDEF domain-containing protein [Clostridium sp. OS1-26]|uniref:GGDEF domain-containing protein n=1 Tax=Clostridium sp. OS1-26 TaxID=3070681 RepID=UPI0027E1A8D2|nr:GGDEF domain-containing protein [Clostridium sp. OS1-26]WML34160.1 GGDEF domain-containing protein [Clostridium sp. OS1-26]